MTAVAARDWHERQASADQAVSVVRPGDKVFVGSACATPRALLGALEELRRPGVVLVHFLTDRVGIGDPPQTAYRHRVFYVGADVRDLLGPTRMVEYLPLSLADVPRLFDNGQLPIDAAVRQGAPPDPDGTGSRRVPVDGTKARPLAERTVTDQRHPRMPRPPGDTRTPPRPI